MLHIHKLVIWPFCLLILCTLLYAWYWGDKEKVDIAMSKIIKPPKSP